MSLLRRKRRQNRMVSKTIPETREARTSLEPFELSSVRGFRINREINRSLGILRNAEQKRLRKLRWTINPLKRIKLARKIVKNVDRFNSRQEHAKASIDFFTGKVYVDLPADHKICKQRKERRELIFAIDKAGKGGQKPRRKDNNINLRCG